jgi:hypothetical protein
MPADVAAPPKPRPIEPHQAMGGHFAARGCQPRRQRAAGSGGGVDREENGVSTVAGESGRRRLRRVRRPVRLVQVLIAVLAVAGATLVTAGPASAAMQCDYQVGLYNVCLSVDGVGDGKYHVHVGIDVHMSLADAQEYLDDDGDPFLAIIRGDDGGGLAEVLSYPTLRGLGASDESGLSADFDATIPGSVLDEDHGDGDEIRAQVRLTDTDTNVVTGEWITAVMVGNWS